MTFAELEYDSKKRRTRREIFLEKMEGLIPWQQLEDRIEPFYAKAGRGRRGRSSCSLERSALLYEVESVRRCGQRSFAGRDDDPVPSPAEPAGRPDSNLSGSDAPMNHTGRLGFR